ncbi:hypothetical protein [Thermoclostridium stercorarium]|nr:hypothetical protein [Thermoclostridium stercorarium]
MLKKLPQVTLFRFDVELDRNKGGIDDGSTENIEYLFKKGMEMWDKNLSEINKFVRLITAGKNKPAK